jgi:hypothetical protein
VPAGVISGEIFAGELLIRFTQRLRLLVPGNTELMRQHLRPICPHLEWFCRDQRLWETIDCQLTHANNSPCAACGMRKSRRECSTCFQVSIRELDDSKTEVRVEAWKYLGPCETPYDPKWRNQAEPRCTKPLGTSITATQWASED